MRPIDTLNAVRIGNRPAPVDSIGFSPSLRQQGRAGQLHQATDLGAEGAAT